MNTETFKKQIITKAIADLSPEDKCLLNRAFVEAQIMAGEENWRYVLSAPPEVLRHACTCPKHSKMSEDQQKSSFASL